MNCSSCNAQIPDGNTFCHQCGAKLETAREPQAETPSKSKTWILLGGIGAAAFVGVKLFGKMIAVLFSSHLIPSLMAVKDIFKGEWNNITIIILVVIGVMAIFGLGKLIFRFVKW